MNMCSDKKCIIIMYVPINLKKKYPTFSIQIPHSLVQF